MDNITRIDSVYIEKLFDLLTYTIEFNSKNDVAILIGPNGYGKTTLFNIIKFMLTGSTDNLRKIINIPFNKCVCRLSNGRVIQLSQDKVHTSEVLKSLNKNPSLPHPQNLIFSTDDTTFSVEDILLGLITEFKNKECNRKKQGVFVDEVIGVDDNLSAKIREKLNLKLQVHFIDTDRIVSKINKDYKILPLWFKKDRTEEWDVNEEKIFNPLKQAKKALTLQYNIPNEKIKTFENILNERYKITKKVIKIERGQIKITANNKEIPLEYLSSGEKNDFMMFYNLIFRYENCVVLLDEPEISLHIEWQERLINDILNICSTNNLQVIIATHSPNIIGEHVDLISKRIDVNE